MTGEDIERTFIAVKPDGVQRGLIGTIITKFEQRGLKLVSLKFLTPSKELLEKHYIEHAGRPFYGALVGFMHSGPVCVMVWEGEGAVKAGRKILGATNPIDSEPGTIRGDFGLTIDRNICHGSDSKESAKKEIELWFKPEEIVQYSSALTKWVYP